MIAAIVLRLNYGANLYVPVGLTGFFVFEVVHWKNKKLLWMKTV